ncbi:hypothetical protein NEOKW01_1557 [Nematocida sp. AWRm80]|nr:hypothetical protein NEOKW01_1557 [Nematocida sp. AWRm80]
MAKDKERREQRAMKAFILLLALLGVLMAFLWMMDIMNDDEVSITNMKTKSTVDINSEIDRSLLEPVSYITLGIWLSKRISDEGFLNTYIPNYYLPGVLKDESIRRVKEVDTMLKSYSQKYQSYINQSKQSKGSQNSNMLLKRIIRRIFITGQLTRQILLASSNPKKVLKDNNILNDQYELQCNEETDQNILNWCLQGYTKETIDLLLLLLKRVDQPGQFFETPRKIIEQLVILIGVLPSNTAKRRVIGMYKATIDSVINCINKILDIHEGFDKEQKELEKNYSGSKLKAKLNQLQKRKTKRDKMLAKNITIQEDTYLRLVTILADTLYGCTIDMSNYFSTLTMDIRERMNSQGYGTKRDPNRKGHLIFIDLPEKYLNCKYQNSLLKGIRALNIQMFLLDSRPITEQNLLAKIVDQTIVILTQIITMIENLSALAVLDTIYAFHVTPLDYLMPEILTVTNTLIDTKIGIPSRITEYSDLLIRRIESIENTNNKILIPEDYLDDSDISNDTRAKEKRQRVEKEKEEEQKEWKEAQEEAIKQAITNQTAEQATWQSLFSYCPDRPGISNEEIRIETAKILEAKRKNPEFIKALEKTPTKEKLKQILSSGAKDFKQEMLRIKLSWEWKVKKNASVNKK